MSERCPNRFPPLCKNWSDFLEINNFDKNKTFQVDVWPVSCLNDSEIQDRGLKELNQKNFSRGNMLRAAPLEACAFGSRFRKSVSIYPRSAPDVHFTLRGPRQGDSLRASSQ